jgi:hypothetical protein
MNSLLDFLLLITTVVIVLVLFSLYKLVYFGKQVAAHRSRLLKDHQKWVDYFLGLLVVAVLLIELIVLQQGGRWGSSRLFTLHMLLVVAFSLSIIGMRLIWPGVYYPKQHRILFKFFIAFFCGVALTGIVLISQLLSKI